MTTGHVFVTRGNITRLAVDAWLLPTDRRLNISPSWFTDTFARELVTSADGNGHFADLRAETVLAMALPTEKGQPTPVLTAVPYEGAAGFEELEERLEAGLKEAARVAREKEAARVAEEKTNRPIIATPAFGVRGGGADRRRGEVIAGILQAADRIAEAERVDVVVCLRQDVDHALAQKARLARWASSAPLPPVQMDEVRRLAKLIEQGRLVPFMGSGVSATAGLPTWGELLELLAADLPDKPDPSGWFRGLSALDQAHVVRGNRGKTEFGQAVAKHTNAERYGLAPILLAALPTREAVTLNYDRLYETAALDADQPAAVLPFEPLQESQRWLLKMHGCVSHPESIVLTRGDYIDFRSHGATAASLAKAILMTKHLLFVGFGLSDDHFHDIVHEVGESSKKTEVFGTALVLGEALGHRAVWGNRISFVPFTDKCGEEEDRAKQARSLEIFLDVLGAYATRSEAFVMDERYDSEILPAERAAKEHFRDFLKLHGKEIRDTVIGRELSDVWTRLGGRTSDAPGLGDQ